MSGPLALVGGGEWSEGCTFDRELVDAVGAQEVLVLPTASAYEHPDRLVATATAWFRALGVATRGLMVLSRLDALDPANVDAVRAARLVYLAGTSPMHLRSVLKDSLLWDALLEAWNGGAALAGSSAGAMVLCDPMVDQRGGAFTLGLGLLSGVAVVPHHDSWSEEKAHRTRQLAPKGLVVAGVDERTALVRDGTGAWAARGAGEVSVWRDGETLGLEALP
ncbi:MAG TPA: Type 1 glutamine amidotransferase-like domain-containing protein [Acidimicrobiales bacterium]|nr:Type 1 glutamine amidotransferase-like domain-containing protein [Acidimicrobiales bacterium]